ncbi:MAG TPA: exo-beta-N-acetylmuramidase NamZ domain-containing protein [Vicinamibacterales bacterium]|nr:exo-beta-N-acetylmuramidase NamZ domain-containing protein [Vicinamibacterales bacterium]
MPATRRDERHRIALSLALALALAALTTIVIAQSPATPPSSAVARAGFDAARLATVDRLVADAIGAHQLPGAVLVVGRGDTIVWRKAYGRRAVTPASEPMTLDTIFDLASLTKVLATAPAVMQLVEQGRLRLSDPVVTYIPEFGAHGKERITILDLLTHMSGLPPDLDLTTTWSGHGEAIRRAADETPQAPRGQRFIYSDVNFLLLADIVARVSGEAFETYVARHILTPLGMRDTMFLPPASLRARIAPTTAAIARGVVHDPTARRMGGVAGQAGLFGTADDLARFCRMMLHGGALGPARVLSPLAVSRMTSPATPVDEPNVRGLGWDLDSSYSANRGDLFPLGSYGHTGFTGGSIWIDPATRVFVVLLSNRVHPDGGGNVTPLRAKVATVVASAVTDLPARTTANLAWPRPAPPAAASTSAPARATLDVAAGIDVLRAQGFALLKGLRVGLLTNHTGVARDGATTIDLLASAPGVTLVSLFSPEHGIRGVLDASVPSTMDEKTGLPIRSLYGATQRPTPEMLDGLDAIVVDLQDVGARFYSYAATMAWVMEGAAAKHLKVIVLDRPNPIGGVEIEGPPLDPSAPGIVGYMREMPIRHGLTIGELARLFNGERKIGADLTVVAMTGWRRDAWFDETGLAWISPSPNMRTLYAAALYPGIGAFERTNLSVGRGTDTPFEHVGAPWIDATALAARLNARHIPGVRFYPETFTPTASTFANERCHGVFMLVTDRDTLRPVRVGVEIASAIESLYPGKLDVDKAATLFGSADGLSQLKASADPDTLAASWTDADARWRALTRPYLLY